MCRRFSASSQTALCAAVEDVGGDLLARVRGQAVEDDRVGIGLGEQRLVDRPAVERRQALAPLCFLAHARPDVRDDDVSSANGLARI